MELNFPLNGSGKLWSDSTGVVIVLKISDEWEYLFGHVQKLPSFISSGENANSKALPGKLQSCFKRKK